MTLALREAPRLETRAAIPLRALGYFGNAGRAETTFPTTLAFPRAVRPLTGILCSPKSGLGVAVCARTEVLDVGISPPLPWGEVWGVRLRKPITGLSLWLEGAEAARYRLAWSCCFRFLGFSDPAGPADWRTGLHGKDPLIALRVVLAPLDGDADRPSPAQRECTQ